MSIFFLSSPPISLVQVLGGAASSHKGLCQEVALRVASERVMDAYAYSILCPEGPEAPQAIRLLRGIKHAVAKMGYRVYLAHSCEHMDAPDEAPDEEADKIVREVVCMLEREEAVSMFVGRQEAAARGTGRGAKLSEDGRYYEELRALTRRLDVAEREWEREQVAKVRRHLFLGGPENNMPSRHGR